MSDWDSGFLMPNNEATFDAAMEQLRVQAINLATHLSVDPAVRLAYGRNIQAMSQDLRMQAKLGYISWSEAAAQANTLRNELMEIARSRSTPLGKAMAEQLKKNGKTLNETVAKYTLEIFGKNADFTRLRPDQQNTVFAKVVERSGVSNPKVNLDMMRLSMAGRALWVISISLAVYNISTAQNKVEAAQKEAGYAGAGIAGGVAGGALAGLICGPGAPVCVAVGAFVGGTLAAFGLQAFW